jgi:hypothetical protein
LPFAASSVIIPEHSFYTALAATASYDNASESERADLRALFSDHAEKLRKYAANCADNYLGKSQLVEAEIARIDGRAEEAAALYDKAAVSARASGFTHNEGMSHELAARFYKGRGDAEAAGRHLRAAKSCYERWQARGKVKQLEAEHPELATA